ncbi:hypothetical protein WCE55_02755 [Luteimonas sp. MJ293]|uniref:hypothetical protein n=1 Tax=Luteimonas sp. MJ146 TaxID=3129240 RepID=UPI0031BB51B2
MIVPRISIPMLAVLLAAGCATGDEMAMQDADNIDFLCEREYRAAREQPIAAGAPGNEARALRGQHVSQRCARAWREANEVRVPLNRPRNPIPLP